MAWGRARWGGVPVSRRAAPRVRSGRKPPPPGGSFRAARWEPYIRAEAASPRCARCSGEKAEMPKAPLVHHQGSACSRSRCSHCCPRPPTCSPGASRRIRSPALRPGRRCAAAGPGGGLAVPVSAGHLTGFHYYYLFLFLNGFMCRKQSSDLQVSTMVRLPEANLAVLPIGETAPCIWVWDLVALIIQAGTVLAELIRQSPSCLLFEFRVCRGCHEPSLTMVLFGMQD